MNKMMLSAISTADSLWARKWATAELHLLTVCAAVREADRGSGEAGGLQDAGPRAAHGPQFLSSAHRPPGAVGHHAVRSVRSAVNPVTGTHDL